MKCKVFLILALCFGCLGVGAQSRSFKGSKNVLLHGGVSKYGSYVGLGFDSKVSNRVFLGVLAGSESTQQEILQMKSTFFEILAKWEAFQFEKLHFTLGAGPSLVFDRVVNTEVIDERATKIGLNYGVHADYVFGRLYVTAGAMQRSYSSEKFGKHRYMLGGGVGISF